MPVWSFLRHGESVANAGGWLAGHADVDLTPRGVEQATAATAELADVPFDRVLVSDLLRARRTAALALPGHPVTLDRALRERTLGAWDGRSRKDLSAIGAMATLLTWHRRPPQGESHADLARRAIAALAAHDTGQDTLVVCHGGLMRAVLGVVDGTPPDAIPFVRFPNCALQVRALPEAGWRSLLETLGPE